MKVEVEKITDVGLLRRANSFTTGRSSKMTLAQAYRAGHSPIRTQLFWVECTDVPLFVVSQLVRSHVGVQFFQRSKRTDRGGADFTIICNHIAQRLIEYQKTGNHITYQLAIDEIIKLPELFDRYAPTDVAFIINAEALMNMAHKRLCAKASSETRDLMTQIGLGIAIVDKDLSQHLVPQCVYRGGICPEPKCCGWIFGGVGRTVLEEYLKTMYNTKETKDNKQNELE